MVKVRPTSSWVGIDVSMTRERDTLCLALDELFLASAASGSSPYIHGSTPCVLQSPGRLINRVRLVDQLNLPYITSHAITAVYYNGLKPPVGFKLFIEPPSSCLVLGFL